MCAGVRFLSADKRMSKKLSISIKHKTYPGHPAVKALGNLAFDVAPEETVCVLGPIGCGKSTLLRLIVGIDTDFEGTLILGNRTIQGPEKDCGIVFQEPRLLPWCTVRQNISFGLYDESNRRQFEIQISDLIRLLGLSDFTNAFPNQLSGGMAQRVALARALINIPDLLLLDEPFASLDQITKMNLQDELAKVLKAEKTTTLMVTHDIDEAIYLSDRIMIMSQRPGEIVKIFPVKLPKPRERANQAFAEIHSEILRYMSTALNLF